MYIVYWKKDRKTEWEYIEVSTKEHMLALVSDIVENHYKVQVKFKEQSKQG